MISVLFLLFLFNLKHFILDFLYQPPYQWQNKGTYAHPGGILHAGQHALGSFFILVLFTNSWWAAGLSLFEFVVHYHVDWAKMNINKDMRWNADKNPEFWMLLGADQYLHYLTYLVLAAGVFL